MLLMTVSACSTFSRVRVVDDVRMDVPDASAVIFLVDGLDRGVLRRMIDEGEVPHIAERFVRGGVAVENAVASLPSISYPNIVSLMTGCLPGHHGVLGNRWFDPVSVTGRDYARPRTYRKVNHDFAARTIYEVLGDSYTVNVQGFVIRGVSESIDNRVGSGLDWLFGAYSRVDARVGRSVDTVVARARRAGRWPEAMLFYFPGVDEIGHRHGPQSSEYVDAIRIADAAIGRIVKRFEAEGLLERTYFVLVADHGQVACENLGSDALVSRLLPSDSNDSRSVRDRVLTGPKISHRRRKNIAKLERRDLVVIVGADRRVAVHFRKSVSLAASAAALVGAPGVGLVCSRNPAGGIDVRSSAGSIVVERRRGGAGAEYRVVSQRPGDVANVLRIDRGSALEAFVEAGWHGSRDWLKATAHARYPDFVPQVVEMFDSPRAGDLVVFADGDFSFGDQWPGGHGSCAKADMLVPMYFAGPGLSAGGAVNCARLVDVMPTLLDLLGRYDRVGDIDGVSIVDQLRGIGRDR
jgi:Type I phosphodiesterase / nucleotide pyrophosphatase